VGDQTGGRVFIFLETDDFWRDYRAMTERGVVFCRPPSEEPYGTGAGAGGSVRDEDRSDPAPRTRRSVGA